MENGIVISFKKSGEVLAVQMRRIRVEHDIAESVPMTYAGRLDPAADGLMMYLVGEERHKKDEYLKKEKEYTFSILCGIQTDTADLLGKVSSHVAVQGYTIGEVQNFADKIVSAIKKDHKLPVPCFSGYKVEGKPLWTFAKEGKKPAVVIKKMNVKSCIVGVPQPISFDDVLKKVKNLFKMTEGDFRKTECLQSWDKIKSDIKDTPLYVIECTVHVSAGTYIRSLVEFLAKKYQMPLCAFQITRTKIGDFDSEAVLTK